MWRVWPATFGPSTYEDTLLILDRLDIHTEGGLKDLADRIDALEAKIREK
jgi:hypothetical protein